MKRYPASVARERLAEVLDEAERNGSAVIERRDVQYVITAKRRPRRKTSAKSSIDILDPSVESGEWEWTWTPSGVKFKGRRTRS